MSTHVMVGVMTHEGIQFIVDDSGGFSGVAGEFLENIVDEYTNSISFSKLSTFSKLIVPMGLPSLRTSRMSKYLYLEDQKPYHSSAVYASAIHSISLPFRMQPLGPSAQLSYTCGAVDVNELVQMLAGQVRQNMVMALDIAMPAPALSDIQCRQSLLENLHPLTPEIAENVEDMHALESMTIHGVFGSGCKRASLSEVKDAVQTAYSTAAERPRFSHLSVAQCPLPIPLPFPSIFGNLVGQHGELSDTPISESASRGSLEVHSIPMAARLRSSSCVLPFLENRLENLRKFGIARGALGSELLASWGFGKDDVEDMGETLSNMVRTLNPVSELSSDSD
ncbi:hypothetical protein Sango_0680300 [Sesamum angolense]|uniref:DML1/Misato tubulin domain-containing protein n=1 Tax=Sesamum angolense TaxID=2727404 RepID=A0AAE1X8E2_9LAMI|nr:hypothetical protein Sango_0680300 [Sesamum angolense]